MRYLILTLLLVPLRGTALPITNGSFELPTLTTTQNLAGPFTLTGWTGQGPSNGGNAGLVVGPDNGLAPAYGLQHFNFNGGNPSDQGYLEQTLPTTPGAQYSLSFALGRAGGGQLLSLTLFDQTYLPPATTGYQYHTHPFTATDPFTTLRFTDTSGPNSISDLYLDAITLTTASPVPDTTGPEIILLAGILLLALRRL
jgi:hypothetical protein